MATRVQEREGGVGESLRLVLAVVGREVRDSLRDWRIAVPIVMLTLLFPLIMTFVANSAIEWVASYGGAAIIGERMLPFLLMIVGFFPISFSLVIALETFAGERERKSLEPLLATILSDAELYVGKTVGAMIPPLLAAYLGVGVYLTGLYWFEGWSPPLELFALVIVLTTAECLVMVSGAVVVSSQTTSVRAANLLASFIIIPMALLVQGEALVMFWGNYDALWWIVAFLIVADVILVRMGVHIFNREELLGREIDQLNLRYVWRTFRHHLQWEPWFFGRDPGRTPAALRWLGALGGLYRRHLPEIIRESRWAVVTVVAAILLAVAVGLGFAAKYPLPPEVLGGQEVSADSFSDAQVMGVLSLTTGGILAHNFRVLVGAALLAVFSFGSLAIALTMAPLAVVAFLVAEAANLGYDPWLFLAVGVLPHGALEIPAVILSTAMAVRLGAAFMSPPKGMGVGEAWLRSLAYFLKVFIFLVVPLLAAAAAVEAHLTPALVVHVFGG
jgi:uncharacterized membrane protein SpoIIM required for sporulation